MQKVENGIALRIADAVTGRQENAIVNRFTENAALHHTAINAALSEERGRKNKQEK
jgi:hypothetical protein